MKEIINRPDIKLLYDVTYNRLLVTVNDIIDHQYTRLVDEFVKAVEKEGADSCLWIVRNEIPANDELMDHTVNQLKKARQSGLKYMALVNPTSKPVKNVVNKFVKDMNTDTIRNFDNEQEAVNWLNEVSGNQRAA